MTNLYYGTVKQILERVSSVMIDREAIKDLVKFVMEVILVKSLLEVYIRNLIANLPDLIINGNYYTLQALNNGEILHELGLDAGIAGERGLRLLHVLSYIFPSHFLHQGK